MGFYNFLVLLLLMSIIAEHGLFSVEIETGTSTFETQGPRRLRHLVPSEGVRHF